MTVWPLPKWSEDHFENMGAKLVSEVLQNQWYRWRRNNDCYCFDPAVREGIKTSLLVLINRYPPQDWNTTDCLYRALKELRFQFLTKKRLLELLRIFCSEKVGSTSLKLWKKLAIVALIYQKSKGMETKNLDVVEGMPDLTVATCLNIWWRIVKNEVANLDNPYIWLQTRRISAVRNSAIIGETFWKQPSALDYCRWCGWWSFANIGS